MMKKIGLLIGLAVISMGVAQKSPSLDSPQPSCLPCCPTHDGWVQC